MSSSAEEFLLVMGEMIPVQSLFPWDENHNINVRYIISEAQLKVSLRSLIIRHYVILLKAL